MKKIKFKNYIGKLVAFTVVFIFSFVLLTLPSFAATETMTFNLWSKYCNSISFGFETSSSTGDVHYDYELDQNSVYVSSDLITTIWHEFSYLNYFDINYIHSFYLFVPDSSLRPQFYISEKFLNKPITFTVTYNASLTDCRFASTFTLKPYFDFYIGTKDNYDVVSCEYKNIFIDLADNSYYYKADFTVTFKEIGYICGFKFNSESDSNVGVRISDFNSSSQCFVEYTLSPLVFDVGITAEDIQNSVSGGILDATGGNNYDKVDDSSMGAYFDQENAIFDGLGDLQSKYTLPQVLDVLNGNLDLKNGLISIGNYIQNFYNNVSFIRVLILISMSLGSIGFIFGLVQTAIKRSSK